MYQEDLARRPAAGPSSRSATRTADEDDNCAVARASLEINLYPSPRQTAPLGNARRAGVRDFDRARTQCVAAGGKTGEACHALHIIDTIIS